MCNWLVAKFRLAKKRKAAPRKNWQSCDAQMEMRSYADSQTCTWQMCSFFVWGGGTETGASSYVRLIS